MVIDSIETLIEISFRRFWWRNILYVSNLSSADKMCVSWTWSLACDMQFFMITTLILFVYVK